MSGPTVEAIGLPNGLTLKIYDRSRKLAGDRWLVCLEAEIEVEILPSWFEEGNPSGPDLEQAREVLGERVVFRYEKRRHFVGQHERRAVFEELRTRFLETSLRYLSSRDLPLRLIRRRYQEAIRSGPTWKTF